MTPRRPGSSTSSLERAIEHALVPGNFISYGAAFSFICGLEEVESEIARLVATAPSEAVSLYETFLAGCYEKSEEIDDSSGGLGEFVGELYCGWVRARQAACGDALDTAARLAQRMEDDPHGYCYRLEKKVATALDAPGLDAFAAELRRRFDAAAVPAPSSDAAHLRIGPGRSRRRWGDALRALSLHQGDVAAYVALAEQLEVTADDCDTIAGMLVAQAKAVDALSWVDRGLVLAEQSRRSATVGADLAKLRREILAALGRGDESLSDAWTAFTHHPSAYTYRELMRYVPESDRGAWHERAIAAASSAELHSHLQLLLETGELERLAALVRTTSGEDLEGVSYYATEPAATRLEQVYPDAAARLWRAQGFRLVNGKKSKYYDAALRNFERARQCYQKAGLTAEWQRLVAVVRAEHRRKIGFMNGFEELVAGAGPASRPSFLERARARWGEGHGGSGSES